MPDKLPSASAAKGLPPIAGIKAEPAGPSAADAMIDPQLAALPAPSHVHLPPSDSPNGISPSMTITESIALAPQPRTTDFSMLPLNEEGLDLEALDTAAEEGTPGSPTAKLMKAIAPPNAAQPNPNWLAVSERFSALISYRGRRKAGGSAACREGATRNIELMWHHFRIASAQCERQLVHR